MIPLMSFWPSINKKILDQTKIIEYRRTFPKDCEFAYMYISKPVKAICGIIEFGKIYSLEDWKNEYIDNPQIIKRIYEYNSSYRFAAEIKSIQRIKPISLDTIRKNIPNFFAPQSYIILENNIKLKEFIFNNTIPLGNKIINDFENAYPEHICKKY